MCPDEQAIRDLQQAWFTATIDKDLPAILQLMAEDVVFLTPGRPPFGRDEFIAGFEAMRQMPMQCSGSMEEVILHGDIAYARAKLSVTVTPPNGEPKRLAGYTLSVYRKLADGRWVLARDANLLTPQ